MVSNQPKRTLKTFIVEYWYIILGAIFVAPYIVSYLKKSFVDAKVDNVENDIKYQSDINALDSPVIQEQNASTILKGMSADQAKRLNADVKAYVHHMGVNYDWYSLYSWSENDKEANMILMKWIKFMDKFGELYYKVYTQSRNLRTDYNKYMDSDQKQKMYEHQTKHNVKYF